MKPGDTVRYLNATGGGVITRIEGQIAYVDEDGFETPMLTRELVVVLPAGHQQSGARLMFDQAAYDAGKAPYSSATPKASASKAGAKQSGGDASAAPAAPAARRGSLRPAMPVTEGRFQLSLVFEPTDIKALSSSRFTALMVNGSKYTVTFAMSARAAGEKLWHLIAADTLEADEILEVADFSHADLPAIEQVAVQAFAYVDDADFALCQPLSASRRLDITKFHKLHCFRQNPEFDSPVLEFQLSGPTEPDLTPLLSRSTSPASTKTGEEVKNGPKEKKGKKTQGANPNVAGELIEVDLHIHQLTDTTAGMQPADMLEMQLEAVRKTMEANKRRLGQKIVFIHGKGEGVLRNAVTKLLKREYPYAELQDASFREYGFGATLVTIHQIKK